MKQTKSISRIKIVGILFLLVIAKANFAQEISITFDVLTVNSGYNVSCYGMSDGAIDMTVFGEFPPFTFSWSNGATTEDLTNIPAGTYTVTVTDDIGNWNAKTVTLHQPDMFTVSLDPTVYKGGYNISTMGGNDGGIKTTISGGTAGYTYVWNTGSTDADLGALTAGNYTVTVTDKNGCTATNHTTLTQPTPLHIVSIVPANHNGHNVSCDGGHDGSIDLTVAGGTTPYHYTWSNGAFVEDPTGLQAGQYMVQVTDANNATAQTQITLTAPAALTASLSTSSFNGYNISCNSCFNGTISTAVTGGTSGYTYSWASGQTSANLTALGVGSYSLTVTDANGCTTTATTALTEPANVGWDFGGNAIDSTKFIGSINNAPLVFKTNNTERARISETGDVTFQKNLNFGGGGNISYTPASSGTGDRFVLGGSQSYSRSPFVNSCIHLANINSKTTFDFQGLFRSGSGPYGPANGQQIDLMTMGCDGNNGIIEVSGDHTISYGVGPDLLVNTQCGRNTYFGNSGSGSVFIGVTAPHVFTGTSIYRLFVEGGIITRDVKVTANSFPDYVFEKDYKLMTIYELEQYLNENKHLPELPSAKEIEKNEGYEIGDMQTKLVKKVEEQTLYIIDLQKQMDELKKEIKRLIPDPSPKEKGDGTEKNK